MLDSRAELGALIAAELHTVPLANWGFFFPCHLAAWRFIHVRRPSRLGPLKARWDSEPVFEGLGAEWFCEKLGNDNQYLSAVEDIMRRTVDRLPVSAWDRGFLFAEEVPEIPDRSLATLLESIQKQLSEADE